MKVSIDFPRRFLSKEDLQYQKINNLTHNFKALTPPLRSVPYSGCVNVSDFAPF
jgi:hypothetical protein